MLIHNEADTTENNDFFEIDTDRRTVTAIYTFEDADEAGQFDGPESKSMTPREYVANIIDGKQDKNDNNYGELEQFLEEHEFVIDWRYRATQPSYNVAIFHIRTFKGLPVEFVGDWIKSELDLRVYKNEHRGKITGGKYGF